MSQQGLSRAPNAGVALRFMQNTLGVEPWAKQRDIVASVFGPARTTVVRSCTGAGKTKVAADICLAWLMTAPGRMVISTAPTGRQVSELLWKEIRSSYAMAAARGFPLGGFMPPRAPELRIADGWVALGFSSGDPVNFQGWHSHGGTLVVVDEAVGVNEGTFDALEATLSGEHDRMLALANPTVPAGRFYELNKTQSGDSVSRIHISAYDTPNVVAGKTVIPGLTTLEFVEDRKKRWGADSGMFRARILGEFPEGDELALTPLSWVDDAVERWRQLGFEDKVPRAGQEGVIVEAGLDVARLGQDRSVLGEVRFSKSCIYVAPLHKLEKATTMRTAAIVVDLIRELKTRIVRVDADGIGAGVYDRMMELVPRHTAEIRGGRTATEPTRYANQRSEMLWNVREALRPEAFPPLALPPDDDLAFQITTLRWTERSDGRLAIEGKDEWRRRTGKSSPDELDALAMGLARGVGEKRRFAFG